MQPNVQSGPGGGQAVEIFYLTIFYHLNDKSQTQFNSELEVV